MTNELCVGDVCVNEEQLRALLENADIQTVEVELPEEVQLQQIESVEVQPQNIDVDETDQTVEVEPPSVENVASTTPEIIAGDSVATTSPDVL